MRKLDSKKIVIATHNAGKLQEIADLICSYGFEICPISDFCLPVPEETGANFEENSWIKAFSAAKTTGIPALSDDSGLEVDALNGKPGIYTADWARQANGTRDFFKAMEKIENELQKIGAVHKHERSGRFVSVICVAWPDGHAEYFRGEIEGTLVWPPRGSKGFGFDPVFQPEGHEYTFGEMTACEKHGWKRGEKNALSHRARAFRYFAETMLESR